ncbi:hypothetical protein [uncultured Thiohalocapsa sp.]|uniref:hypothetical protein n=1 Tax=uncultured Thiohalocapsa sp. TaxID=768990 RepID=UPI0025DDBA04|nr:hypothetical protein [uncultured Thiohalocapsa sp.]
MSNSSDPAYERFAEMDFADAKPVKAISALARVQSEHASGQEITVPVDDELLARIAACAERSGDDYRTILHNALARCLEAEPEAQ